MTELLLILDLPVAIGRQRAGMQIPFDVGEQVPDLVEVLQRFFLRPFERVMPVRRAGGQLERLDQDKPVFLLLVLHGGLPLFGLALNARIRRELNYITTRRQPGSNVPIVRCGKVGREISVQTAAPSD